MSLPAGVTFTAAQLAECEASHDHFVLGCPVCFLYLCEAAPYLETAADAARQVLSNPEEDESSQRYARAVLEDVARIWERVRQHVVPRGRVH